jgi:hypothetical protein
MDLLASRIRLQLRPTQVRKWNRCVHCSDVIHGTGVEAWLPDQMLARTLRSANSVAMQDGEEEEQDQDMGDDMLDEEDMQENSEVARQVREAEPQLEEEDGHLIDSAADLFVSGRTYVGERSEYQEEQLRQSKKLPAYMTRFVTTHKVSVLSLFSSNPMT